MDERAELVLKPSWFTVGSAVASGLFVVFVARMWVSHAPGHQGLGDLILPIGMGILVIVQGYRSLQTVKLVLTPTALTVIRGKSAQTVPWNDVEAILPKRMWEGRGSSVGIAVVRRTRGDIRLHNSYGAPREEVYGFLTGYANVHAPHVTTAAIDGPPGV